MAFSAARAVLHVRDKALRHSARPCWLPTLQALCWSEAARVLREHQYTRAVRVHASRRR